MTIDKFGSHISHKYLGKTKYYFCYITFHARDKAQPFVFGKGQTKVLTYSINESINRWHYPLPSGTVVSCKVYNPNIYFILNGKKSINSLENETLMSDDIIYVARPVGSLKTGNGIIELVVKIPISHNE